MADGIKSKSFMAVMRQLIDTDGRLSLHKWKLLIDNQIVVLRRTDACQNGPSIGRYDHAVSELSLITAARGGNASANRSRGGVPVMNKSARFKRQSLVTTGIAVGTLCVGAWRAEADFIQTNLVSDIPGLAALTEPELVNPWGISHTATSPIWVSNQGTNTTNLFAVTAGNDVMKVSPMGTDGNIAIPTAGSGPAQGPTGQVANPNTSDPTIFSVKGGD